MRELPVQRARINRSGNNFTGVNKPHGRVTVEPSWRLRTTGPSYGTRVNGPYRWWARKDQSQVEVEVPNIDSIEINRSIDQDAASCTIIMSNQQHDNNDGSPINTSTLGKPGFYGFGYGSASAWTSDWGHQKNQWSNVLIPNALLRTYQGFGGYVETDGKLVAKPLNTAISDGDIAISGVWLIDTVSFGTNGKIRFECRDMAKLLIDQLVYTPLVPERFYPPKWYRYDYVDVPVAPDAHPTPQPGGPLRLTYEDSTVARWLGKTSALGKLAPRAFTNNETEISFGHGWRHWNNAYAKDWWQATCSGEMNEIYIHTAGVPAGGNYFVWISVMENGQWQGGSFIPYNDGPGSNIDVYHPDKPKLDTNIRFVKATAVKASASVNIHENDGTWVKLPRTYRAQRVRVTIASMWRSPWGPNHFRSAVGSIKARLVNQNPNTEAPAVETTYKTIEVDGNIRDWIDPVRQLLLWSGFLRYDGPNPTVRPGVHGVLESTGTYPLDRIGEETFDKKSVMDAITSIKEVLGHIFFIDEEGGVHFHSPNWWTPGNTTNDGKRRPNYIHEISDERTLTDYTASYTDNSVKSEVVIGTDLPDEESGDTQHVSIDPAVVLPSGSPDLNRGMTRPAIWFSDVWMSADEHKLMAALISLHIMFNSRQGSVTIVANPEIQVNDQVRIMERITSESYIHYVRAIDSTMDLRSGEWTMNLKTNWLGEGDVWAFDRDRLMALQSRVGRR